MGYKDVTDGNKIAKPIGIRYLDKEETKFKSDAFEVMFEFIEESTGNPERMSWIGYTSDEAIPYTMDTLVNRLGFDLHKPISESINLEAEVELVIQTKEHDGKPRKKIQWVNTICGSKFVGISAEDAKAKLADPRIKAAFMVAKQGDAKPAADKPAVKNHAPGAAAAPKKKLPF